MQRAFLAEEFGCRALDGFEACEIEREEDGILPGLGFERRYGCFSFVPASCGKVNFGAMFEKRLVLE